ncbi:GGDEF and EAL domain-containing protein [Pseudoalteromonas piratica]|uniref:GGDEF and EAL domain-containing protein n=1 Tax=Pseudoalteromonas piratica TaxID=1348114 RepID=UPI00069045B2|nr:GGDEF and EAL domain-containing protein [Pseudoalteromonas piratica]
MKRPILFQVCLILFLCIFTTFKTVANDDLAQKLTSLTEFKQHNIAINDLVSLPNGASLIASHEGLYIFSKENLAKADKSLLQDYNSSTFKELSRVNNQLFLATDNQLIKYDLLNQTSHMLVDEHVEKLKTKQQQLYFISKGNLFRYLPYSEKIENLTSELNVLIHDFEIISDTSFWLLTNASELLYFENQLHISKRFKLNNPIKTMFLDRKSRLWFTQNNTLSYIDANLTNIASVGLEIPIDAITPIDGSSLILQSEGNLFLFQTDSKNLRPLDLPLITHVFPVENNHILLKHQNNSWFLTSYNQLKLTSDNLSSLFSDKLAHQSIQEIQWQNKYLYIKNESGLWRYHLATEQLIQLINHRGIKQFYLTNRGEIWFSDAQFVYTFDLLTQQLQTKFPFKQSIALIGDIQSPPFIVTKEGIYRNTGELTFALFNSTSQIGEIEFASVFKGKFFVSTNTGFWLLEKQGDNWQSKQLLNTTVTNLNHNGGRYIWLKTPFQTLLFDAEFEQVVTYLNNTNLLRSDFDFFYNEQQLFVTGENVFSYPLNSAPAITPLTGLKLNSISLNNTHHNIISHNITLTEEETQVTLSFYDSEIPTTGLALSYRFSPSSPWIALPVGQNTLTFHVINSSLNTLKVVNRNGLNQQPINLTITHSYFDFNVWKIATLILLSFLALMSSFWWFKHRKNRQYGLTSALLAQTQEAVWICDENLKVINTNKTFYTLTGFSAEDVYGKQLKVFDGETRNTKLEHIIKRAIQEKGSWSGELWSKRKNTELMAISLNITKIRLSSTLGLLTKIHYIGMFKDITQQKQQEKQLRHLATRDQITGLLNRTVFMEQLILAINASSSTQPEFCVLIVNLDNFFKINDGLGHSYGDRVLKLAAQRLEQTLPPNYTLANLGGDEFGILLPPHIFSPLNIFNIKSLCEKLLSELARTIRLDDIELCLSASIGAAIYPDNGFDSESILRSADSALQHAKANGKNTFQIFNRAIKTHTPASLSIENEINRAIIDKEFTLYYQPKFNTRTNQVCGVEALARWPDGNNEIRSPAQFISVAEANNAIIPLTRVLIEVCCRQIKQWQTKGVQINGRIALNLSAIHFQRSDLIEDLTNYLQKYQITGDCMELEITESVMMNDPEFALQQMHKLKRLGFTIALDDFGTGHSSLSYLKKFPIDRLKIDRSFVVDIEHSEQDRNITATIIRLAKYLNIDVVAEGVETEAQSYFLHVMGCDVVQGYFFSKPLPCDQLEKFIEQTKVLINQPKSN